LIRYPEGLPFILMDGSELETVDPQLRTSLGNGRVRVRRKFSQTPQYKSGTVLMRTYQQAALFEGWWEHVLVSGTNWFEAPITTPLGTEMRVVRFAGVYSGPAKVGPTLWQFSFRLELRKRAILPAEWVQPDAAEWILHASDFDILMNRTWPEA